VTYVTAERWYDIFPDGEDVEFMLLSCLPTKVEDSTLVQKRSDMIEDSQTRQ
jgi:hypothetical protein